MFQRLVIPACLLLATVAIAAEQPAATAEKSAAKAESERAPDRSPSAAMGRSPSAAGAGAQERPGAGAQERPSTASAADAKALSGISILGNQEAPKALVIVPWKSSQLGDTLGIAKNLDDGRQPVDKEVFMRQLSYYAIRANSQ